MVNMRLNRLDRDLVDSSVPLSTALKRKAAPYLIIGTTVGILGAILGAILMGLLNASIFIPILFASVGVLTLTVAFGLEVVDAIYLSFDRPKQIREVPGTKLQKIKKAPGARLLSIVEFFYSPATVEETFKSIVADWQAEYFDALSRKRRWKARWISVRYTCRFVHAMGLSKVLEFARSFARAGK